MIVLDVETTGINPDKHSIVSLGALDFFNLRKEPFYGECRIWKGAEIEQKALEINGFTTEQITDPLKSSLEQLIKNFLSWAKPISDKTLAGVNPSFDRDFLKSSIERCNIKYAFGYRTIDLHALCYANMLSRGLMPPQKAERTALDTDKILEYVGLPPEPKPHNALTGAIMEAEAFSRLIHRRNLLPEFRKYGIPITILNPVNH
jgi:DNA polymerase-3 subunit epsilon